MPPALDDFITRADLGRLLATARHEDLGRQHLDVTSQFLVPKGQTAKAAFRPRRPGTLAGVALLPAVLERFDRALQLHILRHDGDTVAPGDSIAEVAGPLRSILAVERTALNFLTHLSGIATLTAAYVATVAGTRARIYDTRKTLPGLRGLEKYAVACGGGANHRLGLYDAMLVKDNHIAHLSLDELPAALDRAIAKATRSTTPPSFVEVEVDTLEQLERVLACPVDIVLLDNMTLDELLAAVALRDRIDPEVELEASGGVHLETVGAIARTGVDRIAIGALTHSAPALDIGLDIA